MGSAIIQHRFKLTTIETRCEEFTFVVENITQHSFAIYGRMLVRGVCRPGNGRLLIGMGMSTKWRWWSRRGKS